MGLLWAAEAVEREAERIIAAMLRAGLQVGDWRALSALVDRVHGRPTEKVEAKNLGQVEAMPLDELRRLRARLLREHPELARLSLVE